MTLEGSEQPPISKEHVVHNGNCVLDTDPPCYLASSPTNPITTKATTTTSIMQLLSEKSKKRRRETPSGDTLQAFRQNLPVYQFRKELIQSITGDVAKDNKVVLVVAETGSGKSTQIPAYLLGTHHRMAVTQPRRVAAVTLATRVSTENQSVTGQRIGYRVRFDDCTSTDTQLTYVTAGMLLREAMVDPLLRRYSILFLDEAHERSLQTDILLGVVVRARRARAVSRSPLKIVVMSATLHVETFQKFFGPENVHTVRIPGRQYPVQLLYTQTPVEDFLEAALSTVLNIHETEEAGDILVFLPGQEEIEDLAALLRQYLQEEEAEQWIGDRVEDLQATGKGVLNHNIPVISGVMICLLYAALPPDVQLAAFADKPEGCTRKIILATNIGK
jgi:ATP-dependent RNA helicase DHX33